MKKLFTLHLFFTAFFLFTLQASYAQTSLCDSSNGVRSLFVGHSFFVPVARGFESHAQRAGFTDHSQLGHFRGGVNGSPIRLWDNAADRAAIQTLLDSNQIELFGMTFHGDYPQIEGYFNWVDYAL